MMGLKRFDRATSIDKIYSAMQKPQGRGFLAEEAKKVNAKTSTKMGTVKVTAAKGFRFGGTKVAQTEAAFA